MQLGYNLSNGVTDTLESSSILIYFETHVGLYTQEGGQMPYWLNGWLNGKLKMPGVCSEEVN